MTVGALEILLVLFFVLLIIGPRRVANLGRSLGRGVRDFKLEIDRDKKSVGDQPSTKWTIPTATAGNLRASLQGAKDPRQGAGRPQAQNLTS